MGPDRNPIEAGLGWCCKEETGFIGSEAVAAARADGTAEKLVPFAIDGRGHPAQGNPILAGGEPAGTVTSGTLLAVAGHRDRDGIRSHRPGRARHRASRSTSAARPRGRDQGKPLYEKSETDRRRPMAEETTQRTCATTPSTTGPGSTARRPPSGSPGTPRTRSARSSSSTRPRSARREQGRALRRGRVGQGGLRRDRTALGRDHRGQRGRSATNPELINEDPYGEGWLVKVKLSDTAELDSLLDAAAYKQLLAD